MLPTLRFKLLFSASEHKSSPTHFGVSFWNVKIYQFYRLDMFGHKTIYRKLFLVVSYMSPRKWELTLTVLLSSLISLLYGSQSFSIHWWSIEILPSSWDTACISPGSFTTLLTLILERIFQQNFWKQNLPPDFHFMATYSASQWMQFFNERMAFTWMPTMAGILLYMYWK